VSAGKQNIRRSMERLLLPALATRGFEHVPAAPNELLRPYGRFRRLREGVFEVIEIQFNKNRTSRFRLNLARTTDEHQWAQDVLPHFHLTARGLTLRRWFGVRKEAREGITESEYDAAVKDVIALLPEVERLFATGRTTRRIERMPMTRWAYLAGMGETLIIVVIPILALVWIVGWLFRNL
jgi:hypothetical protein